MTFTKRRQAVTTALALLGHPDSALAEELLNECPWLDGIEEVEEEIGVNLLGETFAKHGLSLSRCDEFIRAYNDTLKEQFSLRSEAADRASTFEELRSLLVQVGNEGVRPGSDFWLVEDSFSTSVIVIILFSDLRLLQDVRCKLQLILSRSRVFESIDVNSEDGQNILRIGRDVGSLK